MAQASRHAIVHSLGMSDERFLKQIHDAEPRDIKHHFTKDQEITFSSSELEFVKLSMQEFISELCQKIKDKYGIL